jgi:predicted porin
MNKKLLAIAVAGALAAPGVAMAQASSVTISGIFKVGLENISYGNAAPGRMNSSQMNVTDNSSRILFNVTENLGNGLSAVAQLDMRFSPNAAMTAPTSNPIGSGNTWVGLNSTTLGRLTLGRHDLHYGSAPDDTAAKAGALHAAAVSLFDYIQTPGGGGATSAMQAIASGSRTQNVVRYDMPTFSGLDATLAWSGNPVGNIQGDMTCTVAATCATVSPAAGVTTRKGDGWNFAPKFTSGPFQIGYSYWRAKPDLTTGAGAYTVAAFDQRGDSVYGYYKFGGLKIGLGWNKSKLETAANNTVATYGSGTKVAERTAWSLPVSYVMGPHNFVGHYTKAGNSSSSIAGAVTDSTGAKMYAIAYVYDFSARTSAGVTYASIKNDRNAMYNFFTGASFGNVDTTPMAGENPRLLQATVKHAF